MTARRTRAIGAASGVNGVNLNGNLVLTGTTHTNAGTYTDTWTFHDPAGNYADASGSVTDSIGNATPSGTASTEFSYGTPLSGVLLGNILGGVHGAFAFTGSDNGKVLSVGGSPYMETYTFTPTDATDYDTATGIAIVTVDPVTPNGPASTEFSYGTPLSGMLLGNILGGVHGAFAFTGSDNGKVLSVSGSPYSEAYTFTPSDATDYTTATGSATVTVNKTTPIITWANPAAITAGTPLGGGQLDASATIAGTFAYSPPAGTVLAVGNNQTLDVTFTPTDATDFTTATGSVAINVIANHPTITSQASPLPAAETGLTFIVSASGSETGVAATGTGVVRHLRDHRWRAVHLLDQCDGKQPHRHVQRPLAWRP